ncbi:MAG: endo-1,4-beta-xylanase [Alphaproteobacteria bacterium]
MPPWPSRRAFLGLSAAAFAGLPAIARAALAPELPSLKQLARAKGLVYGSDSDVAVANEPPQYASLFLSQCELIAPIMSWSYVSSPTSEEIVREDPNVSFALKTGLKLTGGHFLWYASLPRWFLAINDRKTAMDAALEHIRRMAANYAGHVFSWNVVNEALNPRDGRPDGLRLGALLDRLGTGFFDAAFRVARAADPHALLAYNDYDMEMDRTDHEAKRRALLRLLEQFKRDSTPIDAVGLQSHLKLDGSRFDAKLYRAFLKDIASMGYKILITELDVLDTKAPSGIAARDQAVADMYARFLDPALDEPMVRAVITWGLSDRYTWLTPDSAPIFARADGLPTRPLPFDGDFRPKPAFQALANAFKNAPSR